MDKKTLRQQLLQDFTTITAEERRSLSEALARNLLALPELSRPTTVMLFLSMSDELDTDPLIRGALAAGHRLYSPLTQRKSRRLIPVRLASLAEVKVGAFGIRVPAGEETIEPAELGVVVVPAVAFDRRGWRLGRGGGYYDRFLERISPKTVTCGVTFSRYVLEQVPTEPHDLPVQILVTDTEILRFPSSRPIG